MDNKKDNEDSVKDIQNNALAILGSSPKDLYIYRKAEKVCSAIHYITNFISEKEPIRLVLRDRSVNLISLALSLMDHTDTPAHFSSLSKCLIEIRSLLQSAFFSGLISEMNLNIIKDELDVLLSMMEAKRQGLFSLSSSFMAIPLPQIQEKREDYKGQSQGQDKSQSQGQNEPKHIGQTIINRENIKPIPKPIMVATEVGQSNQSERTNKIFNLLKAGKELTIKDFSIIKGCSEKTLQRELLRLVAEGRIIKRGERRWSRYSLQ